VNDDSARMKRASVRTSRRSFLMRLFFGAGDSRRRRKRKIRGV
jgi:hypothetical protein